MAPWEDCLDLRDLVCCALRPVCAVKHPPCAVISHVERIYLVVELVLQLIVNPVLVGLYSRWQSEHDRSPPLTGNETPKRDARDL